MRITLGSFVNRPGLLRALDEDVASWYPAANA